MCRLITSNILSEPCYKFYWFPYSEAGATNFCRSLAISFMMTDIYWLLIISIETGRLPLIDMFVEFVTPITQAAFAVGSMFVTQYCAGAGHVARMGEERGVYRVVLGKPEGRRPLGRPRRRWVDNIRMDLQEVGCGYMDWIGLAQDRDRWRTLVRAVMNLRVPWNAGNFLTSCKPVSFSRRTLHHGVGKWVSEWVSN